MSIKYACVRKGDRTIAESPQGEDANAFAGPLQALLTTVNKSSQGSGSDGGGYQRKMEEDKENKVKIFYISSGNRTVGCVTTLDMQMQTVSVFLEDLDGVIRDTKIHESSDEEQNERKEEICRVISDRVSEFNKEARRMKKQASGGGSGGGRQNSFSQLEVEEELQPSPIISSSMWFSIGYIIMLEGMCFTAIIPFTGYLVSSFSQNLDTATAGYVSGLIMSCNYLGTTIWASRWGRAADHYSNRTVLLCGVFAVSTCLTLFGFSRSLYWALAARLGMGVLSSNVSNCKAILLGAVKGFKKQEAQVASFIAVLGSLGEILGPIIGGTLYYPCSETSPLKQLPEALHHFLQFHDESSPFCYYRPLLPCMVVGGMGFGAFVCAFFLLPETKEDPEPFGPMEWILTVLDPFISVWSSFCGSKSSTTDDENASSSVVSSPGSPTMRSPNGRNPIAKISLSDVWNIPMLRTSVQVFVGLRAANIVFLEVFPLFAIAPKSVGGIQWAETQVGVFLAASTVASFVGNLMFIKAEQLVGRMRLLTLSLGTMVPVTLLFPCLVFFNQEGIHVQLMIAIAFGVVRNGVQGFLFPLCDPLLSAASPPGTLSQVQGHAQSLASLSRLLLPMSMAPIFAWSISSPHQFPFNQFFVFILLSLVLLLTLVLSRQFSNIKPSAAGGSEKTKDGEDAPLKGGKKLDYGATTTTGKGSSSK